MAMRVAALALVGALFGAGGETSAQPPAVADEVARGKEQVSQGKYQEAVATLIGVVRLLPWTGVRDPEAAPAFLYLGLAYAGLGQASPATSQFVQALRRDPTISPDPQTTPAASLEIFADAVKEAKATGLMDGDAAKKHGSGAKRAIGAGAVLAGVTALVVARTGFKGSETGSPPTIANLVVGPIQAADVAVGLFFLEFDFQDADGDITIVVVEVSGQGEAKNPLPEAAAKTQGHVRLSQTLSLPPRGVEVGITVSVEDSQGRASNPLRGVTVFP